MIAIQARSAAACSTKAPGAIRPSTVRRARDAQLRRRRRKTATSCFAIHTRNKTNARPGARRARRVAASKDTSFARGDFGTLRARERKARGLQKHALCGSWRSVITDGSSWFSCWERSVWRARHVAERHATSQLHPSREPPRLRRRRPTSRRRAPTHPRAFHATTLTRKAPRTMSEGRESATPSPFCCEPHPMGLRERRTRSNC